MPQSLTTGSLAERSVASGLISPETLHALGVRFPTELGSDAGFRELLLREQLLTGWQVNKLSAGKSRGFFLGPYKLQSHLARGGMSTLYVAEHMDTREKRALKVLSPVKAQQASYLPRFIREAKLASQFRHDNIVRVFDLMKVSDGLSDIHFMVMELLDGRDLFQKVTLGGPPSIREAAELIRQAAVGLGHSHRRGLVHRDVKPGNLFLTRTGTVKVVDLGLATLVENEDESLTRDCNERVIGTADYLAPEQAIDSHRADSRADIYALGCTFYFLLTGRPPFAEGSLAQRILAHQSKQPQDVRKLRPELPEELADLLSGMLVKRRARRVQTCEEAVERLQQWLQNHADDDQFDRPGMASGVSETADRLVGRKLQRISPPQRRTPTETPTDSIRAAETQTGQGNALERPSKPPEIPERAASEATASAATSSVPANCEQFEAFLEHLDIETGAQSVMSPESRQHSRRALSQTAAVPDVTASAVETSPRITNAEVGLSVTDSSATSSVAETARRIDAPRIGRLILTVVAVAMLLAMIGLADATWLRQLSHLLRKFW